MYTLYYMNGSCSLATLSVLNEIGVDGVKVVDKAKVDNYEHINPVGAVPALTDGSTTLREGAALLLHLLDKHDNDLLSKEGKARQQAIEDIMFANATMHPAYGRLFFLDQAVEDDGVKGDLMNKAAAMISQLWDVVELRLKDQDYLGGDKPSAADFMLTVYSRWGGFFPVDVVIPAKASKMIENVLARDSFVKALDMEKSV